MSHASANPSPASAADHAPAQVVPGHVHSQAHDELNGVHAAVESLNRVEDALGAVREHTDVTSQTNSAGAANPATELLAADQALAGDLDMLLEGDFESIDAVLREVDGIAAEPSDASADRDQQPTASGSSAGQEGATDSDSPMARTAEQASESDPLHTSAAQEHEGDSVEQTASSSVAKVRRVSSVPLKQTLMATLVMMNAPLRIVPATMRPLVDIIAASLVIWVPIVWLMGTVIGTGSATAEHSDSTEHSPAMHRESTNNASEHGSDHGSEHGSGHGSDEHSGGHGSKSSASKAQAGSSSSSSKSKAAANKTGKTSKSAGHAAPPASHH